MLSVGLGEVGSRLLKKLIKSEVEEAFRLVLQGGDGPLPLVDIEGELGHSPGSRVLVRVLGSDFEDLDVEEASSLVFSDLI